MHRINKKAELLPWMFQYMTLQESDEFRKSYIKISFVFRRLFIIFIFLNIWYNRCKNKIYIHCRLYRIKHIACVVTHSNQTNIPTYTKISNEVVTDKCTFFMKQKKDQQTWKQVSLDFNRIEALRNKIEKFSQDGKLSWLKS